MRPGPLRSGRFPMRQGACKPGSVPPAVSEDPSCGGSHSSGPCIAARLKQPTRAARRETRLPRLPGARRPYSVLLRVGFAVRPLLPAARCALAAPFHPCCGPKPVSGLLSVALSLGSPPAGVTRHPCFAEPGLSSTEVSFRRGCPAPWRRRYLARPRSRSNSSSNSRAPISPSSSPSMQRGRQRRWNAMIAARPSVMS